MRPRFQNHQNRVRSDLAVPAEKRSYGLSARITQRKYAARKERPGCSDTGSRVRTAEESRHITPIGLVREFPKDKDAWREVDRLGLGVRINDAPAPGRASFHFLAEHYLKADFGADAVRPKSANTIPIVEHIVRDYLIQRFGEQIAEDIKPLEIQKWLKSLNETNGLAWTTIAKMRGLMHRIYKVGILHEHVAKNPVLHVETRSKSNYRAIIITPAQTVAILKSLPSPFTTRWCSPVRRRRSARRRFWRYAGRTCCGTREGSGFQSAGPREKTEKQKRMHRTVTSRCIRS